VSPPPDSGRRRLLRAARSLCGIAVLAVGFAALAPPVSADRAEDLRHLREAIDRSRERVAAYERQQRSLLEAVEALDRAAAVLAREVAVAHARVLRTRTELRKVESEAEEIERQLRATERAMSRRAVALYKAGELAGVRILFSAGGIREFLARIGALRLLLERDVQLLERHRAESASFAAAQQRAREAAEASEEAASRLRERESQLASERGVKKRLIARLHDDRTEERAALVELEKAARALEETLVALRDAPTGTRGALSGPPFASLQHELPPPVDVPIARGFGRVVDEEFFTETFRKGVEYDAPEGAPVRAVADGDVRFAGWFRGFGRLVILDHGDEYFTVSGHLSEMSVEVGDRVSRGDAIGAVGETGSLSGPQLYFEIRRGGAPLDPRDWLQQGDSR
jgi:septal ring factor EnvC (AmiA/AmiB activator)